MPVRSLIYQLALNISDIIDSTMLFLDVERAVSYTSPNRK
jgi:hypothetical protein